MDQRGHGLNDVPEEEHALLAHTVMSRQAGLSLRIAALFAAMLFGLPLVNYLLPGLAGRRVLGFTASWLFLGVLFYPLTWLLSWIFIVSSDRIEAGAQDWRSVLGREAGDPPEPELPGGIRPAFVEPSEPRDEERG